MKVTHCGTHFPVLRVDVMSLEIFCLKKSGEKLLIQNIALLCNKLTYIRSKNITSVLFNYFTPLTENLTRVYVDPESIFDSNDLTLNLFSTRLIVFLCEAFIRCQGTKCKRWCQQYQEVIFLASKK
jgi:hypothetical protein